MVKNGWAWTYRKDKTYIKEMQQAKISKLGLWKSPDNIEPYLWRKSSY